MNSRNPHYQKNYVAARMEWERTYFRAVVETSPSMSAAARRTGMERSALYRKLAHLGLEVQPGSGFGFST